MTTPDCELSVTPPPIVKTLILLRVALLEIEALRREVMTLPQPGRAPLQIALESLERKARQLSAAARKV